MLIVLKCCGSVSCVVRSGHFVGHVFINLAYLIQVSLTCDLKFYFVSLAFYVCFHFWLFLVIMIVWKAVFYLSVPLIVIVSVDLH